MKAKPLRKQTRTGRVPVKSGNAQFEVKNGVRTPVAGGRKNHASPKAE